MTRTWTSRDDKAARCQAYGALAAAYGLQRILNPCILQLMVRLGLEPTWYVTFYC